MLSQAKYAEQQNNISFLSKLCNKKKISYQEITNIDENIEESQKYMISKFMITSFKSQYIKCSDDTIQIDETKSSWNDVLESITDNSTIFDLILCIWWIFTLLTTILCLIQLYGDSNIMFYIILSLFLLGTLSNILCPFVWRGPWKKSNLLLSLMYSLLFIVIGPTILLFIGNAPGNERLIPFISYCFVTSLPQSIILLHVILYTYNIYFVLSFISSSLIIICWGMLLLRIGLKEIIKAPFRANMRYSFALNAITFIMDYLLLIAIIIYSFCDSTNIILYIFICNESVTVIFILSYFVLRKWISSDWPWSGTNCISYLFMVFFVIMLVICIAFSCNAWIFVLYDEFEQDLDFNLLRWIQNGNDNKMKRLCLVNGLIMDYCQEREDKNEEINNLKQYFIANCPNNFEDVTLREIAKKLQGLQWPNIDLFGSNNIENDSLNRCQSILMTICKFMWCLYLLSRFNKIVFLPIFIGIYLNIYNKLNIIVSVSIFIQFIFIIIELIIFIMIWNEIYFSLYLIRCDMFSSSTHLKQDELNKLIKKNIGYYYNAMSIYELEDELTKYIPSDIAHIILLFLLDNNNKYEFEYDDYDDYESDGQWPGESDDYNDYEWRHQCPAVSDDDTSSSQSF